MQKVEVKWEMRFLALSFKVAPLFVRTARRSITKCMGAQTDDTGLGSAAADANDQHWLTPPEWRSREVQNFGYRISKGAQEFGFLCPFRLKVMVIQ